MQPKLPANDPDCNVYVANLPCNYDTTRLYILFSPYGKIIRHKFVAGELKSQPGYGFVQFAERHQAQNAIKQLNNYTFPTGETIYISLALHRRSSLSDEPTNLYVTNVPSEWKNAMLHQTFSKYGSIRQCKIIKAGIAFVRYDDHNQALDAIDHLNGTDLGLHVEFATRKTAATSYQLKKIPGPTAKNSHNLYVRNLPNNYTQKQLEKLFKQYGKICAAKLNNKGIAFVRYVHAEDALHTIEKLHRTVPDGFEQEIVVKLAHFDIGNTNSIISNVSNVSNQNEMGFDEASAFKAAKKYPKNMNSAINYITSKQQEEKKEDNSANKTQSKQQIKEPIKTIVPLSKQPAIQILLKSFISVMKFKSDSVLLNSLMSLLNDVDFSLDSNTLQTILDARLAEYVGETRLNAFLDLQHNYWQLLKQSISAIKPFERRSKINYNLIEQCRKKLKVHDKANLQYVQNLGASLKKWLEEQHKLRPLAIKWSKFAEQCQKENIKWKGIVTRNKNVRRELQKQGRITKILGWISIASGIASAALGIFLKQDLLVQGGVSLIGTGAGALTVKHQQFDKKFKYNKAMGVKVKLIQQKLKQMTKTAHNMDAILDQIKNTIDEAFGSLDELQLLIENRQSFEIQLEAFSNIFKEFKDNGTKCIIALTKAQNKYITN